jgi:DNA repair exonuclease SbcCD ATPase subunit
MVEQIQQQDLQEKIDTLTFEIQSLSEELEAAKKAKSQYARELMNDPDAQERRLELLAAGHETICEFSQEQLGKLNNLGNVIKGLESKIVERHAAIGKIEKTIAVQQQLGAAKTAIEPKIGKFNQCLAQLQEAWEELRSVAAEHDIEFQNQIIPGKAELEERTQPGFENWLKIYFGE